MKRAIPTDQFQQESGEPEHRQSTVPDLRTVVPSPFPFLLGVKLHLGGEFRCGIEAHLRARKASGHQIGQPLDERRIGVESPDPTEN